MAALPAPSLSLATDHSDPQNGSDHSKKTAPHTPPREATSATKIVAHQKRPHLTRDKLVLPPSNNKSATQARRPQCTHMMMNRLYGNYICHMCGKIPDLGFLYGCQQDHLRRVQSDGSNTEAPPSVSDSSGCFNAQAQIAKSIGMSASVIKQMRAGEYSQTQIETLLSQRRHVREVIKQAEHAQARVIPPSPHMLMNQIAASRPSESIIASAGMGPVSTVHQSPPTGLPTHKTGGPFHLTMDDFTRPRKKSFKNTQCNFQVCHTCRPFFQDRVPMSFGAALNGEIPPITNSDLSNMPVRNATVVRKIGLREPPNPLPATSMEGNETIFQENSNEDELEDNTPTSSGSDWTDEISNLMDLDNPHPCPGAGFCPVYSPTEGCAYDLGFDDGNRATNHGFVSVALDHETDEPSQVSSHSHRIRGGITDTPSGTSSAGSSVSLPATPVTSSKMTFPLDFTGENKLGKKFTKAATICGDSDELRRTKGLYALGILSKSSSSLGSEVEVEGGVALTEEAVETGIPDIIVHQD